MLHDAGRAFRAKYAAINRMIRVAFDITHLSIFNMDINSAAAGAHITGRLFDLVADWFLQIEYRFRHAAYCEGIAEKTRENIVVGAGSTAIETVTLRQSQTFDRW